MSSLLSFFLQLIHNSKDFYVLIPIRLGIFFRVYMNTGWKIKREKIFLMNEYWMSESQGDLQNCDVATVLKIKKNMEKNTLLKSMYSILF